MDVDARSSNACSLLHFIFLSLIFFLNLLGVDEIEQRHDAAYFVRHDMATAKWEYTVSIFPLFKYFRWQSSICVATKKTSRMGIEIPFPLLKKFVRLLRLMITKVSATYLRILAWSFPALTFQVSTTSITRLPRKLEMHGVYFVLFIDSRT